MYVNVIQTSTTGLEIYMSSSVLSVRLSEEERELLESASAQARTNLSDFVRRKAIEAAEVDVLGRRIVTIPAKDWERLRLPYWPYWGPLLTVLHAHRAEIPRLAPHNAAS